MLPPSNTSKEVIFQFHKGTIKTGVPSGVEEAKRISIP